MKATTLLKLVGIAFLMGVGAMIVVSLPELKRYVKISTM